MTDHEQTSQESAILPNDILSKDDVPFKTKGAASVVLSNKGLTDTHTVAQVDDGFVIRPIPASVKEGRIQKGNEDEKVLKVRIRPAQNNLTTNARIAMPGVNGEMLFLKRGRTYPVPERFLQAMDATMHPTSRHVVGQDRMDTMWIQDDDYDVVGDSSWDEYKKWAAETDRGRNE